MKYPLKSKIEIPRDATVSLFDNSVHVAASRRRYLTTDGYSYVEWSEQKEIRLSLSMGSLSKENESMRPGDVLAVYPLYSRIGGEVVIDIIARLLAFDNDKATVSVEVSFEGPSWAQMRQRNKKT